MISSQYTENNSLYVDVWTNNAIAIHDQWSREEDQITKDMITSVKTAFINVCRLMVLNLIKVRGLHKSSMKP